MHRDWFVNCGTWGRQALTIWETACGIYNDSLNDLKFFFCKLRPVLNNQVYSNGLSTKDKNAGRLGSDFSSTTSRFKGSKAFSHTKRIKIKKRRYVCEGWTVKDPAGRAATPRTHMRVTSATHLEASSRFTHQLHLNKSGGGTWKEAESHLTLRVHDNRHVILMTRQTAACVLSDDV